MVIQHNLTALNSNRQLGITTGLQAKSSEKLSSGYKINRAADDAAGLAISEKMRRQIRGLDQASNNVQDGISYVQVADAALAEIDDMLNRMNELCIQASNDTLTSEDRSYIDAEIQQLKTECNRTFHTTTFNEKLIWDEHTTDRKVVGTEERPIYKWSNGGDYYTLPVNDTNAGAWPSDNKLTINATDTGIKLNWTGYDGKSYESNTVNWPSEEELRSGYNLSLKSSDPAASDIAPQLRIYLDDDASISQMAQELNGSTISASGNLSLSANVLGNAGTTYFGGTLNYITGLVYRNDMGGSEDRIDQKAYTATGTNRKESIAPNTDDPAKNMTFQFSFKKRGSETDTFTVTAKYNTRVSTTSYADEEISRGIWWNADKYGNKSHGSKSPGSIADLEAAVTAALDVQTDPRTGHSAKLSDVGGYLKINFSLTSDTELSYGSGTSKLTTDEGAVGNLYIELYVAKGESTNSVLNRIKNITGLDITNSSTASKTLYNPDSNTFMANIYSGTMKLNIQAGSESSDDNIIPIIYDVLNNHTLGINDLDTLSRDNALAGVNKVHSAARIVDEQRSIFGAYQNRMEHAHNNLNNVVENTQQAESLIRDTDMAAEMVKHSNENILAQAGQAMLAQANQTNQGVLSLLQ
jgi:flagellin